MEALCRKLRCKVVRDLVWAMGSPGLLCENSTEMRWLSDMAGSRLVELSAAWIDDLDKNPSDLVSYLLAPKRNAQRLGLYMAALVEYFIEKCPALCCRRLATAKQIVRGDVVVGSLKFVFCCAPTDLDLMKALQLNHVPGLVHWEVSIKFFVYVGPKTNDLANYCGPFLHENLAKRVDTSRRKISLSKEINVRRWATKELYYNHEVNDSIVKTITSASVLRGFLFYELGSCIIHEESPLSASHARGWWTRDVAAMKKFLRGTHVVVLPKLYWLSPAVCRRSGSSFLLDEAPVVADFDAAVCVPLADFYVVTETPLMLALFEGDDVKFETSRGFLLPKNWSHENMPSLIDRSKAIKSSKHPKEGDETYAIHVDEIVVDAGESPVKSPSDFVERLAGRRYGHDRKGKKVKRIEILVDRARALLIATGDERLVFGMKVLESIGENELRLPRAIASKFARAVFLAMKREDFKSEEVRSAADSLFRRAIDEDDSCRLDLEVALDCITSFSTLDDTFFQSRLEAALFEKDHRKLVSAAKLATLRKFRLASPFLVRVVECLAEGGALDVAKRLVSAHENKDAATALVEACDNFGHSTFAKKLAKELEVPTQTQSLPEIFLSLPEIFSRSLVVCRDRVRTRQEDGRVVLAMSETVAIKVVDCLEEIAAAHGVLKVSSILGVDVEWPPFQPSARASLLQIASPETVFLFDLDALAETNASLGPDFELLVRDIFYDHTRTKLAFGCRSDVSKLRESFEVFAFLDESHFFDLQRKNKGGLSESCLQVLGAGVSKDEQCSDWSRRPLSPSQKRYAALDAYVLLALAAPSEFDQTCFPMEITEDKDLSQNTIIAKSLAVVSETDPHLRVVAVLPLQHHTLNFPALERALQTPNLRLAREKDLLRHFAYERGVLGPIGPGVPVVIDDKLTSKTIACGCGHKGRHLVFQANDLVAFSSSSSSSKEEPGGATTKKEPTTTFSSKNKIRPPTTAIFAAISSTCP